MSNNICKCHEATTLKKQIRYLKRYNTHQKKHITMLQRIIRAKEAIKRIEKSKKQCELKQDGFCVVFDKSDIINDDDSVLSDTSDDNPDQSQIRTVHFDE